MLNLSECRIAAGATLFALLSVGACDGPNETAGRDRDRAAAAVNGVEPAGKGANEVAGERLDRAERAAEKVRDAQADALERQADQIRTDADLSADRLEDQAKKTREGTR